MLGTSTGAWGSQQGSLKCLCVSPCPVEVSSLATPMTNALTSVISAMVTLEIMKLTFSVNIKEHFFFFW
jgi:hypothetical protein